MLIKESALTKHSERRNRQPSQVSSYLRPLKFGTHIPFTSQRQDTYQWVELGASKGLDSFQNGCSCHALAFLTYVAHQLDLSL